MMNKMTFCKNFNWKSAVPHVIAVLIFLTLTLIYFSPVLDGKDIRQDDAIGSMGWGKDARDYHEESGEYSYWSNAMFSGMPCNYTYSPQPDNAFMPIGEVLTLHVFGASYRHIGCIFLTFIGGYILLLALGCKPWLSIAGAIVYTLGSYNFIIIGAGHMNKSLVIATMAPVIGGIILCYKRKLLAGALVTIIFAGLNVYWSHQQVSYYLLITAFIMAIVYFIYAYREKWLKYYWKATGVLAVVAILAVAPAVGILLPTNDYAKSSMRGGSEIKEDGSSGLDVDYAFAWSYGKAESLTLLVPNLYGSASNLSKDGKFYKYYKDNERRVQLDIFNKCYEKTAYGYAAQIAATNPGVSEREALQYILQDSNLEKQVSQIAINNTYEVLQSIKDYWGPQAKYKTSGPVYVGAIVCFLFVLGLMIVRGPEKWWLLAATIFSLMLAWGSNLSGVNTFLFEHMPLYNKFRAPSMALVVTTLTMSTLAILAVKRFLEPSNKVCKCKQGSFTMDKALYIAFCITGGIALFLAVMPDVFLDFKSPTDGFIAEFPDIYSKLVDSRKDMLVSDAWRSFWFITGAATLMYIYKWIKMKNLYFVVALGLLFLFDMWPVCKRYVNDDMFMPKKETITISDTDADKEVRRLAKLAGDVHYRVYNQAYTFNESFTSYKHNSIGGYSPAKLARYQDLIEAHLDNKNMNVISMLNAKYIIKGERARDIEVNDDAFGNCWMVNNIVWVNNAKEEIAAIENIDKQTAYIDKMWLKDVPNYEQYINNTPGEDEIKLTEYRNPGNIIYESECSAPKLAVFSEVYYKTWKAYIDGKEVTPIRANYILRALPIPAGEHTIEFKCVDELMIKSHKWSHYVSILVWIVIVGAIGFGIYRKVKK